MRAGAEPSRSDDLLVLEMLDMRAQGCTYREIAASLGVQFRWASSVLNAVDRDDRATPDHMRHVDGTMPARWWAGGAK